MDVFGQLGCEGFSHELVVSVQEGYQAVVLYVISLLLLEDRAHMAEGEACRRVHHMGLYVIDYSGHALHHIKAWGFILAVCFEHTVQVLPHLVGYPVWASSCAKFDILQCSLHIHSGEGSVQGGLVGCSVSVSKGSC